MVITKALLVRREAMPGKADAVGIANDTDRSDWWPCMASSQESHSPRFDYE